MRPVVLLFFPIFLAGCAWFLEPGVVPERTVPPEDISTPLDGNTTPPGISEAAEGAMCGGIAAIQCESGLTCIYEDGACHSIADAAGICRKTGPVCTKEYRPVCGCDGETYGNRCEAYAAGTSVAYPGECKITES